MKSRKLLVVLGLMLVVAGFSTNAKALTLDLGGKFAFDVPVGDMSDGAGMGLGALFSGDLFFTDMIGATMELGYIYHLEKNSINFSQIPVMLGGKFKFGEKPIVPYALAMVGLVHAKAEAEACAFGICKSVESSDDNFGMAAGGGVLYSINDALAISGDARFMISDLEHSSDTMQILITVGVVYSLGF